MRAHSSGRVMSFVTERDGVRWRKILHLTGYDVSDAVHTTLALDISMSILRSRLHRDYFHAPCTPLWSAAQAPGNFIFTA
jgi:hypothetical protein